ncbi:MAG TPA: tripartite tricarboxylate transporter substrate binding protein [Usitatibacter sp.]|nr:tripartite tricarboxylate transporter substrate binding protein [Usitatibacter sp.]
MKGIAGLVLGLWALAAGSLPALAAYPEKPIRLVVGFPPGSQPDIVARLLAQDLGQALGAPVVVENITGASGNIAADRVAKAAPDGYTLGLLSQTHIVVNPSLHKLPYDPVKDFAPVTQVAVSPNLLVVSPALPARTAGELVALAKAQPGALTFASSGSGSGTHMAAELFKSATAVDIRHIPYKGVVAAIPDLLANRVSLMFSPIPVVLPLVREGKLRALAVTSLRRSVAVPDVPTVAEAGYPGFEATNWYGLLAPARTPAAIVGTLHAEAVKALRRPELRGKLENLGLDVIANSPGQFAAAIESEIPKWRKLIHDSGMKPD